ncbi:MAG: DUF1844 domain-containing protein [Vicinamibacteria bacterium]|nr:DUF1844 domain-containing protein [Vicinamibacteria bacterium]
MDEAEPNLKVTDRRHFTADGELRGDAPSPSASPAVEAEGHTAAAPDASEAPPVNFSSFIISLATQAADFISGEQKNLGAARQVISAIEMLKDKTEGRRTEDESRIVDGILFDLRLAFVGSAKGSKS